MMQVAFSQLISAWTREMSAPGRRRSVSLRRPIVNSGLSVLTMRRPSASVMTSLGAGGESFIASRLYATADARMARAPVQADDRVRRYAVQRLADSEECAHDPGRDRPRRGARDRPQGFRAVRIGP